MELRLLHPQMKLLQLACTTEPKNHVLARCTAAILPWQPSCSGAAQAQQRVPSPSATSPRASPGLGQLDTGSRSLSAGQARWRNEASVSCEVPTSPTQSASRNALWTTAQHCLGAPTIFFCLRPCKAPLLGDRPSSRKTKRRLFPGAKSTLYAQLASPVFPSMSAGAVRFPFASTPRCCDVDRTRS